jgi:DMSO/TMAO reductase YedYZ molybdopterin-dependent catalytic subunit
MGINSTLERSVRRFNAGNSLLKRAIIRLGYYVFIIFPRPLRRVLAAAFIEVVLFVKKVTGVERQDGLTAQNEVGTLSFWGVPTVDVARFTVTVDGAVENPRLFRYDDLLAFPSTERLIRMDCVGGFRNNTMMRGVLLSEVLAIVKPTTDARRAVFHCADGYVEASTLADLEAADAMLVYSTNQASEDRLGYPLRLALPGKYGYKWPKWIQRVEIVTHHRLGYWPQRGLPDRAEVGDRW